jgi:hypothetical protein
MNKSFIITEEERSRILNHHIAATKKQYIKEDDMYGSPTDDVEIDVEEKEEKPNFYADLRDVTMPYYKREQGFKKLSSEERIERLKHTISELESYIGILKNEIKGEEERSSENY